MLGTHLTAQTRGLGYVDMGSNNVSEGLTLKTAALVHVQFGRNSVEAGLQLDLKSDNSSVFSGYSISYSRALQVKQFPFQLQGFCIWTPYSGLLRETNWGILLSGSKNHFSMQLGNEFRSIAFTQRAIENYGYNKEDKIRENWNLVYTFEYRLKPVEFPWNIDFAITNMDHFLISQETNPIFRVHGQYEVSSTQELFMEVWYKSAGAFNLSVNYFGFFIRTGIAWDIP